MLKLITTSSNAKLGKIAATYRAGRTDCFGTCPSTCNLKPVNRTGTDAVDLAYLTALEDAVPTQGLAWTYTHFKPSDGIPKPKQGKTVFNLSCDSLDEAVEFFNQGYPVVVAVPKAQDDKVLKHKGVKFVRCPAEYREEVTCENCGYYNPLCARADRTYVVKFTAHGTQAKKVGSEEQGGCYGSGGPVAIHWKNTVNALQEGSDAEKLSAWVKKLPKYGRIRHHIVGDVGHD